MPATIFITLKVTDNEALTEYRKLGGAAVAKHSGEAILVGKTGETLQGDPLDVDSIVILSFPEEENARAWLSDPELADVHALRNKGAQTSITIVA